MLSRRPAMMSMMYLYQPTTDYVPLHSSCFERVRGRSQGGDHSSAEKVGDRWSSVGVKAEGDQRGDRAGY